MVLTVSAKTPDMVWVYDWQDRAVEVITSAQRRRRWSAEERARSVQETYAPGWRGGTVSQHVVHLTTAIWRRRAVHCGAGEEVVPASEYRALHYHVRELQRLLGKKTLENEILREALELARPKKRLLRSPSPARDGTP
jgi:transposase